MPAADDKKRLGRILAGVFVLALLMGPGPGLYLVNPDPGSPNSAATIGNVPVLYVWALLWCAVQVTVLLVAYFKVWGRPDDSA